jgi:DNA-binding HxlR family transcriptional regulator
MRSYGQYCPISRASEILAERWTMLVVRNLLLGCSTFTEIAHGVPGMSRTLLSQRLGTLRDAGVVRVLPNPGRRGQRYELTEAGLALWDVVRPLAQWGRKWLDMRREHSDPSVVLWAWVHFHLCRERLPKKRVVARFDFPEERADHRRFWLLVEHATAELCYSDPGFDCDVFVKARSEPFVRWHVGDLEWRDAVQNGDIELTGSARLVRALPTWNLRALE